MRRYTPGLLAVAATLAILSACASTATPPTGSGPAAGSSAGAATQSAAAKPPLPTNGRCVLITTEKAASLVGSTVTSSSANLNGNGEGVHVDGCTFVGASANLGYDVNDFTNGAVSASVFIAQAKAAMAAQPGVTPFDVTGGDASVAFTVRIGSKVMARIEVAKGPYTVAVNSTAPDAETARKISAGALAVLLAAVG